MSGPQIGKIIFIILALFCCRFDALPQNELNRRGKSFDQIEESQKDPSPKASTEQTSLVVDLLRKNEEIRAERDGLRDRNIVMFAALLFSLIIIGFLVFVVVVNSIRIKSLQENNKKGLKATENLIRSESLLRKIRENVRAANLNQAIKLLSQMAEHSSNENDQKLADAITFSYNNLKFQENTGVLPKEYHTIKQNIAVRILDLANDIHSAKKTEVMIDLPN